MKKADPQQHPMTAIGQIGRPGIEPGEVMVVGPGEQFLCSAAERIRYLARGSARDPGTPGPPGADIVEYVRIRPSQVETTLGREEPSVTDLLG